MSIVDDRVAANQFVSALRAALFHAADLAASAAHEPVRLAELAQLVEDAKFLIDCRSAAGTRPQVDALAPPELD